MARNIKKTFLRTFLAVFATSLTFGLAFMGAERNAIAATDGKTENYAEFFNVSNGDATYSFSERGLQVDFSNVNAPTTTLRYSEAMPVSELKNAISFRLLNAANEMPVEWMHVVLRDSEDPTRLVNIIVNKSTAWDDSSKSTKGVVSLLDTEYIDMISTYGRLGLKGKSGTQVVGLDDWQGTGYTIKGAFNIGTWNQYGPYLWSATGETKAMTFGIENNVVKVKGANDAIIADLTNSDFLTESVAGLDTTDDADIIAKYQSEYVSNIFTSGNATVEVTFGASMQSTTATLPDFSINITGVGDTKVSSVQIDTTTSMNIYKGQSGTVTASNQGKLYAFSGNNFTATTNEIALPGTFDFDLATYSGEIARFQIIPDTTTAYTTLFEMWITDSENADKLLNIIVAYNKRSGNWSVTALAALNKAGGYYTCDKTNGFNRTGPTAQPAWGDRYARFDVAKEGAAYKVYNTAGDAIVSSGSGDLVISSGSLLLERYGYAHSSAIIVEYVDGVFTVNGYKVFDVNDTDYLTAIGTTKETIDNLFSSKKVNVTLKIDGAGYEANTSGNVNVINLFGVAGYETVEVLENVFTDTTGPIITVNPAHGNKNGVYATKSEKDKIDATYFDLFDASESKIDSVVVNGNKVTVSAKDAYGHTSQQTFDILEGAIVTLNYDKTAENVIVSGTTYTLPAKVTSDTFIGWNVNGVLKTAGETIDVTESVEISAVSIRMTTGFGASVRKNVNNPGIRWVGTIDLTQKAAIEQTFGKASVQFGMYITSPTKVGYMFIEAETINEKTGEFYAALTFTAAEDRTEYMNTEFKARIAAKVNGQFIFGTDEDTQRSFFEVLKKAYEAGEKLPEELTKELAAVAACNYSIVIPENSSETLSFAATELNNAFYNATGTELEISNDAECTETPVISLGNTALFRESGVNANQQSLNEDGFYIRLQGEKFPNVFLNAENDYGVLNSVFFFAVKYLGAKYLTIDSVEYTEKSVDFSKVVEEEIVPSYNQRDYFAKQTMSYKKESAPFGLETFHSNNAVYQGERVIGGIHGIPYLVPYESNPTCYKTSGTKYQVDLKSGYNYVGGYDTTDPDTLIYKVINAVKEKMLADKTAKYVMLGLNDVDYIPTGYNSPTSYYKNYTDLYLLFVNTVANAVHQWMDTQSASEINKNIRFVAVSYLNTWVDDAGTKIINKPNSYVDVLFCDMKANNILPFYDTTSTYNNSTSQQRYYFWANHINNGTELMVYTYATNFSSSLLWFDNFDALAKDIKFYKNNTKNWQTPTQKITVQGHPHAYNYYQGNLENYVVSKITFNTALEVDDIVHEYNNAYYKDSASVINGIYDELTGLDLSNLKLALYDSSQDYNAYFRAYSVNAVQRYISALDSEISRVKGLSGLTDAEKAERESRIIELRVQFEFMLHLYKTKVNSSFDMSSYGKKLLSDMDKLGIYYYGEEKPITELRALYGTNVDKIATLLFKGNASKDADNPVKYESFSFNMKEDFSVSSSNVDFNEKLNGGQLTLTWTVYHNTTPIISSDPTILKDNATCVYDSFTGSVYAFPNAYKRQGYKIVLTISGYGYFGDLVYYYDMQ